MDSGRQVGPPGYNPLALAGLHTDHNIMSSRGCRRTVSEDGPAIAYAYLERKIVQC